MIRRPRREGYALLMFVASLLAVSIALTLMTAASHQVFVQTQRAHAEASNRSLQSSAVAWARLRAQQGRLPGEAVELDCSGLHAPGGELRVAPAEGDDDRARVRIDSAAARRNWPVRRQRTVTVE